MYPCIVVKCNLLSAVNAKMEVGAYAMDMSKIASTRYEPDIHAFTG